MENKLKISENTVVFCATTKDLEDLFDLMSVLNLKWEIEKSDKGYCYDLHKGQRGYYSYYQDKGYNIISAQNFIALHKEESLLKEYGNLMNDYNLELYKLESKIFNTGIKESDGKLNYELDFEFIQAMAERMSKNKHKYKPYNWKLPINVESLKQSLFRHVIEVMKGNYEDDGMELGHVLGVALNAMMIHYQLKYNKNE